MTNTEIAAILKKHAAWVADAASGSRANLSEADLSRANLSRANLSGANLSGANLYRAKIREPHGLSPAAVLSASWGALPVRLGRLAIALDVANHPDGVAPFRAWAAAPGGPCPYQTEAGRTWAPLVCFYPDRSHFNPKTKPPTLLALASALMDNAGITR